MRLAITTFAVALLSGVAVAAPSNDLAARVSFPTFSSRTIYVPDANYTDPRVLYARTVELGKGVLLSTWENYSPGKLLGHSMKHGTDQCWHFCYSKLSGRLWC